MSATESRAAGLAPLPRPLDAPYKNHAAVLACLALGLTLVIVLLVAHQPRAAVVKVLPTVALTLLASGGVGLWLPAREAVRAWVMLLLPALAGGAGMFVAVAGLAALNGLTLENVLARRLVERALMVGPLLGAMVGLTLLLLVKSRARERAAWEQAVAGQLANERLLRAQALAQLQLLQAQIEPHFLYNTLANLRQLIRIDSTRALAMLEHLIRYFKLALPSFRNDRLPLEHELALVQTYMELLRERLGRTLHLQLNIPPDWHAVQVLPGALLCLVENAIKHGLPTDGGGLMLEISAQREGALLRLTVRDNGAGLGTLTDAESTGTGLRNLRERLRLAYGESAQVQLIDHGQGCEARLAVPWEQP